MSTTKPADQRPIKDLLREKDAFLTTSERFYEYFLRHTKAFVTVGLVVVVGLISAAFYLSYEKSSEEKAHLAHERALEGRPGADTVDQRAATIAALEKVRQDYSGRKAARLASFALINLYSGQPDADQAIGLAENLLQTLRDYEISLKPTLLVNLGGLYESKGDYQKAVDTYQALLDLNPASIDLRIDALLALGRVNAAAGHKEAAIANYETLVKDYPSDRTYRLVLAGSKLAELRDKPPTAETNPTQAEAVPPGSEDVTTPDE